MSNESKQTKTSVPIVRKGDEVTPDKWKRIKAASEKVNLTPQSPDLTHKISLQRFVVALENEDFLQCRYPNGPGGPFDPTLPVAKPANLRGSVTGLWSAGDEVFAVRNVLGGTNTQSLAGFDVVWQLLNTSGRTVTP